MFGPMRGTGANGGLKQKVKLPPPQPIGGDRDITGDSGRRFGQKLHGGEGAMPFTGNESS
jgi:hypothetical protein